jgi:Flp pilus assembly protein TadD
VANAETMRAKLDKARGDKANAIAHLEQAHAATPSTQTLLNLIAGLADFGKRDRAITVADSWLADHPDDPAVLLAQGIQLEQSGQVDRAIARFERVTQLAPNNVTAINNLAWWLHERDPTRAVQLATRALELAPQSGAVMDTLAMAYLAAGRAEEALAASDRALVLEPNSGLFRVHKARVLRHLGRIDEATETLEQALASQPFADRAAAETELEALRAARPQ